VRSERVIITDTGQQDAAKRSHVSIIAPLLPGGRSHKRRQGPREARAWVLPVGFLGYTRAVGEKECLIKHDFSRQQRAAKLAHNGCGGRPFAGSSVRTFNIRSGELFKIYIKKQCNQLCNQEAPAAACNPRSARCCSTRTQATARPMPGPLWSLTPLVAPSPGHNL